MFTSERGSCAAFGLSKLNVPSGSRRYPCRTRFASRYSPTTTPLSLIPWARELYRPSRRIEYRVGPVGGEDEAVGRTNPVHDTDIDPAHDHADRVHIG